MHALLLSKPKTRLLYNKIEQLRYVLELTSPDRIWRARSVTQWPPRVGISLVHLVCPPGLLPGALGT